MHVEEEGVHKDAQPPFVRSLAIKTIRKDARECDFIASTDDEDSYGEIVDQSWVLERFKKNPVVLFAHKSRELPVGKCTRVEVVGRQLECTIKFASTEANPLAENVWQSVLEETLRAVSVGFNPQDIRYEMRNGREVCVLSNNELFEISVTPIPANPNAVAKAKQIAKAANQGERGAKDITETTETTMDYKQQAELLQKQLGDKEAELSNERASSARVARELSDKLEATRAERDEAQRTLTKEREEAAEVSKKLAAAETRAKELADKVGAQAVDLAIEQNKILPAEREDYLEIVKTNPALFERMMARKEPHEITRPKTAEEPAGTTRSTGGQSQADSVKEDEDMFDDLVRQAEKHGDLTELD